MLGLSKLGEESMEDLIIPIIIFVVCGYLVIARRTDRTEDQELTYPLFVIGGGIGVIIYLLAVILYTSGGSTWNF